jgi:hypothetical protein
MIQEALEYMKDVGEQSAASIITHNAEPPHVYFVRNKDGTLTRKEADPLPRSHKAADLQAIIEKVVEAKKASEPVEIWFSRKSVTLFIGEHRRDRVDLALEFSKPLQTLLQWETSKPNLQQAELRKQLRIIFRDCLALAGNLVDIISKVKLVQNSQGDSELTHGRASLGKSIEAQVTGAGTLPEYFQLQVPIFTNPAFASAQYAIECALEPDPSTGTFQVIPIPNRIEKAIAAGEQRIGIMIGEALKDAGAEDTTGKFFGSP